MREGYYEYDALPVAAGVWEEAVPLVSVSFHGLTCAGGGAAGVMGGVEGGRQCRRGRRESETGEGRGMQGRGMDGRGMQGVLGGKGREERGGGGVAGNDGEANGEEVRHKGDSEAPAA